MSQETFVKATKALDLALEEQGDESIDNIYKELAEKSQRKEGDGRGPPVQATPLKQNLQPAEGEETEPMLDAADAGIELPVFHRWIAEKWPGK